MICFVCVCVFYSVQMCIDKVVNQHMADGCTATSTSSTTSSSTSHKHTKSSSVPAVGEKTRVGNREVHTLVPGNNHSKRGRGRPRLTEEEKMRRRELRDMGLMKRSKRRTKEGMSQQCVAVLSVDVAYQRWLNGEQNEYVHLLSEVVSQVQERRTW